MKSCSTIKKVFLLVAALLAITTNVYGASPEVKNNSLEQEDEKLLQQVHLPPDPSRSSEEKTNEQYFQRFVIRTKQGQKFIGAYWYRQGNPVEMVVDIFAIENISPKILARRLYSGDVYAGVQALEVLDFDQDGKDDLILITDTGGMIAKVGVLALRQTPTGLSEVFDTAGNDIWVYREHGQVRIMVKAKSPKFIKEYSWNSSKQTFEVVRTVELLY